MKDLEKNNIKEEDFPKDPENITKDELHEHFDLDNDGKVNIEEYSEQNKDKNLSDFLEEVSLLTDIDRHNTDYESITLMTIHSAKGLEYSLVFIVGLEEGLFYDDYMYANPFHVNGSNASSEFLDESFSGSSELLISNDNMNERWFIFGVKYYFNNKN